MCTCSSSSLGPNDRNPLIASLTIVVIFLAFEFYHEFINIHLHNGTDLNTD